MAAKEMLPLFNPAYELELIGFDKVQQAMNRVLKSGQYISGQEVVQFEQRIAALTGAKHVVAVSSGTTALELCLKVLDLPSQSAVLTNANTFVAAAEAIVNMGFVPSMVDIDADTWQMKAGGTDSTAIVSHLYGHVSHSVFNDFKYLIEDVSQSFGATWKGRYLGTFGDLAAVSLYPTKNLSGVGDAGMVLTDNEEFYQKLMAMRNHGQTVHQQHSLVGTTARMDELQAAVLNLKLNHFTNFVQQRREIVEIYYHRLRNLPLALPHIDTELSPAPNLMVVRYPQRDAIRLFLQERAIATGIHYPTAIHQMPAYKHESWANLQLPETERLHLETFSLPLWVGMTEADVSRVCITLESYFLKG